MSFSVSFMGKPEAIKRKLAEHSTQLSGHSKEEFDAILPSLNTVLDQNFSPSGANVILLEASGHASFREPDNAKLYGTCSVSIKTLGVLCE